MKRSPFYRVLTALVLPRNLDLSLGLLYGWGLTSVEQRTRGGRTLLSAQIPEKVSSTDLLRTLNKTSPVFDRPKILKLREGPWARNYLRHLKPFHLLRKKGNELWMDPSGEKVANRQKNTLILDPSLAFGTGTHPTTQLSAEILDEILAAKKGDSVLDLGCGTGILAMVAKRRGAGEVYAVDNDPIALKVAEENFIRNGIKGIRRAPSLKKIRRRFEIIVANILLSTLLDLKQEIVRHLSPKGHLIVSGLVYKDVAPLLRFYKEWTLRKRLNRKGWSALILKRKT